MKAIVSLPRDVFADMAKTTAKTSILLLIRKDDSDVVQREPVFFAKAVNAGPTGKDLTRSNDLVPICAFFEIWKEKAIEHASTDAPPLTKTRAEIIHDELKPTEANHLQTALYHLDASKQGERLDEAYWCMKFLISEMKEKVTLDSIVDLISSGRQPPSRELFSFATVSRINVRASRKKPATTKYDLSNLQSVRKGDILVSGIDIVFGSVAVAEEDVDGAVVSIEYYILRPKKGIDPYWVVAALRTPAVRRIIEGFITGISNRTRVESGEVLMSLPMPPPPSFEIQKEIGNKLRAARKYFDKMQNSMSDAETQAAAATGLGKVIEAALPEQDEE